MDVLVIGIGNAFRCDDGAGIAVAQAVRLQNLPHVTVIEQSGEGGSLIESWKDADIVFLCDAVSSGSSPGTMYQFDAIKETIPGGFFSYSTHQFSLAEAIAMARIINQLPRDLIVFGIEGESFQFGTTISAVVEKSVAEVTDSMVRQIHEMSISQGSLS